MSGVIWLDWAVLAVSLYNTILLFWLGLTILLNAERHHAGIWLAGGGLLAGAAFFLSHSAILGFSLQESPAVNFWWRLGWILVILAPFGWYVVMSWYSGYWEDRLSPIQRRQRFWFWVLALVTVAMLAVSLVANPLPSFSEITLFETGDFQPAPGAYLVALVYPVFIITCIGLALEALLRPGPTVRIMGQLARQRARPWLAAASGVLLLVSLLVAAFLWWVLIASRMDSAPALSITMLAWVDLVISSLIAGAVTLTGQAIVSYELFTGKTLPRQGLLRYWHWAIILAAGFGGIAGLSLALDLPAIYSFLLSAGLLALFYALLSWRSYVDRERFMSDLRPFVAGPHVFDRLVLPASPPEVSGVQPIFDALCRYVLGARLAFLAPYGPPAMLFGPVLAHPAGSVAPTLEQTIIGRFNPQTLCLPLEHDLPGGVSWVVPLWNQQGLCGALLLGDKLDGSLYTQEEIETARSAGERLVDTQVSAELTRRLLALQRQQLAESQVLDRRARRVLHDDVLPQLHAAMLSLRSDPAAQADQQAEVMELLGEVHHQISNLLRDLPVAIAPELTRLGLVGALRWVVEQEMLGAFDQVDWEIDPQAEQNTRSLQPLMTEVAFYAAREAIRNAARHARPAGSTQPVRLMIAIRVALGGLQIVIEDNGVGLDGLGETSGGSGSGLALHGTLLAIVGASLSVRSEEGAYTCVEIHLP